jgi:hypothetical protein
MTVSCVNLVEYHVNLIEKQISDLLVLKSQLLQSRCSIKRIFPLNCITEFLETKDVLSLSKTCKQIRETLMSPDLKLMIPNLSVSKKVASASDMRLLVMSRLLIPVIETISINSVLDSNSHLLYYLAKQGANLTHLKDFSFEGGHADTDMTNCLVKFLECLPENQLKVIHLSGLKDLSIIEDALKHNRLSLKTVRVDFLNPHHHTTFNKALPIMPNLQNFVLDVAEDCNLDVSSIIHMLGGIQNKQNLRSVYMPHVVLNGNCEDVKPLLTLLPQFTGLSTLLLRFKNFSVPVKEVFNLRMELEFFDSMCISRYFIIGLKYWASWWPTMETVWPGIDRITPFAVLREQIDFNSFDMIPERQWLKLSNEDKQFWTNSVVPKVKSLYRRNVCSSPTLST